MTTTARCHATATSTGLFGYRLGPGGQARPASRMSVNRSAARVGGSTGASVMLGVEYPHAYFAASANDPNRATAPARSMASQRLARAAHSTAWTCPHNSFVENHGYTSHVARPKSCNCQLRPRYDTSSTRTGPPTEPLTRRNPAKAPTGRRATAPPTRSTVRPPDAYRPARRHRPILRRADVRRR